MCGTIIAIYGYNMRQNGCTWQYYNNLTKSGQKLIYSDPPPSYNGPPRYHVRLRKLQENLLNANFSRSAIGFVRSERDLYVLPDISWTPLYS